MSHYCLFSKSIVCCFRTTLDDVTMLAGSENILNFSLRPDAGGGGGEQVCTGSWVAVKVNYGGP